MDADDELDPSCGRPVPVDLFDDLTDELADALERYVLVPDQERAWARMDALRFILDEWFDFDDDAAEFPAWADRHRGTGVHIGSADDGSLIEVESTRASTTVPSEIVDLLIADIVELSEPERGDSLWSLQRLFGNWNTLLVDEEAIYGHLALKHGIQLDPQSATPEAMVRQHSLEHSGTPQRH